MIMNEYLFDDLAVGMTASFTRIITPEMEDLFREISGDQNPLHKDDAFATEVSGGKFNGHVSFGMLTASMYSAVAGMYLPGKYSLIHSFDELSFKNPVYAGDELKADAVITDKNDDLHFIRIKVTIRNQNGKTVSSAKMKVIVLK